MTNYKNQIRSIKIIHAALLIGMLLFLGVNVLFLVSDPIFSMSTVYFPLLIVAPLIAFVGLFVGKNLFIKKLNTIEKNSTLSSKLIQYQTAMIIKLALIEGPVLLSIVSYMIHSNYFFLVIATILIFIFISIRPTITSIKVDLNLTKEEVSLLF